MPNASMMAPVNSNKTSRGESMPAHVVEYLKAWFNDPAHIHHPYPTKYEKRQMVVDFGIELKSLNHWLANYRSRHWRKQMGLGKGERIRPNKRKLRRSIRAGEPHWVDQYYATRHNKLTSGITPVTSSTTVTNNSLPSNENCRSAENASIILPDSCASSSKKTDAPRGMPLDIASYVPPTRKRSLDDVTKFPSSDKIDDNDSESEPSSSFEWYGSPNHSNSAGESTDEEGCWI